MISACTADTDAPSAAAPAVFVLAPFGRDTSFACEFLNGRGVVARGFADMRALCAEIDEACAVVLITEEALTDDGMPHLVEALTGASVRAEPSVLVLTYEHRPVAPDSPAVRLLETLDDVTLIARPVHGRTLLAKVRAALRTRHRLAPHFRPGQNVATADIGFDNYRVLVEAIPLPAFVVSDNTIACANAAAAGLVGVDDAARLAGRSILAYVDPTHSRTMAQCLARSHRPVEAVRQRWQRANGSFVEVDVRVAVPWNGSADALVLAAEVNRPETKEAALRAQIDALHQADRRKEEFIAMLAHELRNPLAPMQNAVHVLRIQPDPPDPKHYRWAIDVIARQLHHVTRLVDDLLDMARLTHDRIKLQKETIDLDRVLAQVVDAARPLTATRRQTLVYTPPSSPIRLDADPMRLAQIVANLLTNASRYTPLDGNIFVGAYRDGAAAAIVVTDDGIGIAESMLKEIFEPFRQGERALEHGRGGLGLGLTLVRRLTELHGGSVQVHSDGPGKGSSFTVRLPALPPDAQAR